MIDEEFTEYFTEIVEMFAEGLNDDEDLDQYFHSFCDHFELDEESRLILFDILAESAEEAVSDEDEAGEDLEEKVRAFLKMLTGTKPDPNKPFVAPKSKPDTYGNNWGKNVQQFDRRKNRYGNNNDVGSSNQANALRSARIPVSESHQRLPNVPIQESLLQPLNPRYLQRLQEYKTFGGNLSETDYSVNHAKDFHETQRLIRERKEQFREDTGNTEEFAAIKSRYKGAK